MSSPKSRGSAFEPVAYRKAIAEMFGALDAGAHRGQHILLVEGGPGAEGLAPDRVVDQPHGLVREAEDHLVMADDAAHAPRDPALEPPPLQELESRHQSETLPLGSPEDMLRRGFAVEVLGAAHQRLRREAIEAGHLPMFEALARFLASDPHPGDYEQIAGRLQVRPLFLSMAVKRLRQRFRELVDYELSETLASGSDMDAERAALMQSLEETPR